MKKYIVTILLSAFASFAFAQSEKIAYKSVADSFEKNYNAENYDAIFLSFATVMQNALPHDKTT